MINNDVNLTLIPTTKQEIFKELEQIVDRAVLKAWKQLKQGPTLETQTNLGTVQWYSGITHKKKNTVYSELCNGKIPKNLIHKPAGTKRVLFYKDRVLAWLESGCVESNEGRA